MHRIAVAFIVGLGLSLLAAPAGAKEFHSAKICGKSKCMVAKDKDDIRGFALTALDADEPPSGPFFTVELTVLDGSGGSDSWTLDYMPDAGLIRVAGEFGEDDWWTLGTGAAERLADMTADLEPFPGSAFPAAMDAPPGTFTTADLASLPEAPTTTDPDPSSRPEPSGTNWVAPLLALVAIGGGVMLARRRATTA